METNIQILRWILQKQEEYDLAFHHVLYFLPYRVAPERADGSL